MNRLGSFPGDDDEGPDFVCHDGYVDDGAEAVATTDPDDDDD